jgi:hypothetical protein
MLLVALSLACGVRGGPPAPIDADLDGATAEVDCDDADGSVHPGAVDEWYDGIDSDCDGADDFDADGDGFAWVMAGGDDCDDTTPRVAPSNDEIPYDGLDNDCDPTTLDNDLDDDGSFWPFDCDDDDPTVGEGVEERIGDGVDEDCDGHVDGTVLLELPFLLQQPHHPRWHTYDGAPALAFAADVATGHTPTGVTDGQVGLWLQPTRSDEVLIVHGGSGGVDPIRAIDAVGDDGVLWVATARDTAAGQRLTVAPFYDVAGQLVRFDTYAVDVGGEAPLSHLDLALDRDGLPWVVGGRDDLLAWLHVDDIGGQVVTDAGGGVAVLGDIVPPLQAMACAETGCARFDLQLQSGAPEPSDDDPPFDGPAVAVGQRDGVLTVVHPTQGATAVVDGVPVPLFPTDALVDAEAVEVGGVVFAVGVTTDERVVFSHGSPVYDVLATTEFTLPRGTWVPLEASVWADADQMAIAVTARPIFDDEPLPDRVFWRALQRVRD